jgi:hypothetical protein
MARAMTTITPPYKAENGNWYTSSLFHEIQRTNAQPERPIEPVFTFTGRPGLIDARKTFIALEDPTGYKWAQEYLHSWEHFQTLLRAKWFRTEYESWCEEIKIVLKSRAIQKISEIAAGGSVQALNAAKYIASAEWEKKGRGRPSSEEVSGELNKAMRDASGFEEDARRMGLTLIQGGK